MTFYLIDLEPFKIECIFTKMSISKGVRQDTVWPSQICSSHCLSLLSLLFEKRHRLQRPAAKRKQGWAIHSFEFLSRRERVVKVIVSLSLMITYQKCHKKLL